MGAFCLISHFLYHKYKAGRTLDVDHHLEAKNLFYESFGHGGQIVEVLHLCS